MGKTPGKWIKNLLLGKKSSKPNLSKKRDISDVSKYVSKGEALVSPEFLAPNSIEESSLISSPTSGTSTVKGVDSEKRVGCWSLNDGVILSVMHEDGNVQDHVNLDSQENLGRVNQEKAATKAQAAFRGYLVKPTVEFATTSFIADRCIEVFQKPNFAPAFAISVARRAFWTLKGIIRLQALTRGHLVRRQAVSTLYCVKGIVKFQALVRGHKVRCSDIGLAVCKICKGAKWSDSNGVKAEKLSKSVVVHKLVASLPTAIPLRLSYGPGEPNTAWEWFDRWTRSRFWEPLPEPNQNRDSISYKENKSCQTVATDKGQPKRGTWKMSGTSMDNGSIDSSDSDRSKRRPRKISSYPVQGHPQVAIEKGKLNSRKIPSSMNGVSDKSEAGTDKQKHIIRKVSGSTAPNVSQKASDSSDKMRDCPVSASEKSDLNISMNFHSADNEINGLHNHPVIDLQTRVNNSRGEGIQGIDLNYSDTCISNEKTKTCQRRASLPAKFDGQDNGVHNTPRLPSYMAPTKSANAKLRGPGSSRFAQDVVEKNVTTRRHSLSSSANGNLSSPSPRVLRLAPVNGRGAIRVDKPLSSSRDGSDKVVQPEWRR